MAAIGPNLYKRQLPLLICAVIIGIIIGEYYSQAPLLTDMRKELLSWGTIVASFTTLLGAFVLALSYFRRSMRTTATGGREWYAIIGVANFIVWGILGIVLPGGFDGTTWRMYSLYLVSWAGAGIGALWLTQASSSYRILRVTNVEMAVFMVGWFLVFTRDMPLWTYVFPWISSATDWYMTVPAVSVQRAVVMAACIGSSIMSIRALLMKEPGMIDVEMA